MNRYPLSFVVTFLSICSNSDSVGGEPSTPPFPAQLAARVYHSVLHVYQYDEQAGQRHLGYASIIKRTDETYFALAPFENIQGIPSSQLYAHHHGPSSGHDQRTSVRVVSCDQHRNLALLEGDGDTSSVPNLVLSLPSDVANGSVPAIACDYRGKELMLQLISIWVGNQSWERSASTSQGSRPNLQHSVCCAPGIPISDFSGRLIAMGQRARVGGAQLITCAQIHAFLTANGHQHVYQASSGSSPTAGFSIIRRKIRADGLQAVARVLGSQ